MLGRLPNLISSQAAELMLPNPIIREFPPPKFRDEFPSWERLANDIAVARGWIDSRVPPEFIPLGTKKSEQLERLLEDWSSDSPVRFIQMNGENVSLEVDIVNPNLAAVMVRHPGKGESWEKEAFIFRRDLETASWRIAFTKESERLMIPLNPEKRSVSMVFGSVSKRLNNLLEDDFPVIRFSRVGEGDDKLTEFMAKMERTRGKFSYKISDEVAVNLEILDRNSFSVTMTTKAFDEDKFPKVTRAFYRREPGGETWKVGGLFVSDGKVSPFNREQRSFYAAEGETTRLMKILLDPTTTLTRPGGRSRLERDAEQFTPVSPP